MKTTREKTSLKAAENMGKPQNSGNHKISIAPMMDWTSITFN
ncbi:MAG: hypothetical protein RIC35_02465 [Marinoscillum sp.]